MTTEEKLAQITGGQICSVSTEFTQRGSENNDVASMLEYMNINGVGLVFKDEDDKNACIESNSIYRMSFHGIESIDFINFAGSTYESCLDSAIQFVSGGQS